MDRYYMEYLNRGKCVVFNHKFFKNQRMQTRFGTEFDVKRIKTTFKKLNFSVEICTDYKYVQIKQKIKELSEEDHSDNDCICIFVLTHGRRNNEISAYDDYYYLEEIWRPFKNCDTLVDKPKLFFFQACKGNKVDKGFQVYRSKMSNQDDVSNNSETNSQEYISKSSFQNNLVPNYTTSNYITSKHADFLLSYATVEGFYSWINESKGSWYVQSLCDILDMYAPTTDLERMLTMARRKVVVEFRSFDNDDSKYNNCKQVPMTNTTLTRDLYFTPKNGQNFSSIV